MLANNIVWHLCKKTKKSGKKEGTVQKVRGNETSLFSTIFPQLTWLYAIDTACADVRAVTEDTI